MQSFGHLAAISVMALAAAPSFATPAVIKGKDFVRQAALPAWAVAPLRAPASEKTDPVVDLVSETQVWVGQTAATLHNRAVLVNDQSALAKIGQFAFNYVPAYQRLLIHRVAIIRKGQVIDHTATVSFRALEREEGLEMGVYGGTKTMLMLLRDVRVGDTLWVTYTIEGANPVFGGMVHRVEAWDSEIPVEQRRLIITYPRKRPIGWAQMGDFVTGKLEPRIEEVGENTRLTFDGRELAAVEGEPSTPAEYVPGRILQFSEFADWKAVAQWASALFESPRSNPQLAELANSLAKGSTPMVRATAALRWVQDEVRYFSVSIGENSHRPQAPEVVLRNRYGDCKDKSRLLVDLLRQMGIEAKPMLVSAFAPRLPDRVKPSPAWFDHVIVRVTIDGRDYFVDPSQAGQTEALANLPPALAGGSGLIVDPATSALIAIPGDSSEVPHFELNEKIAVPEFDGAGTLLAKRYYRGDYAAWARRHFSSLSQPLQRRWALELYEKQYPGVTLLEAPTVAEENGRFVMTARYSLPKPIEHKEKIYSIRYDSRVMDGSLEIPSKIARSYPFFPAYGKYHSRYRLALELPKPLRFNNLPFGSQVDSEYLQMREDYTSRGNFIDYLLEYRVKEDRIPADALRSLHESSKKLSELGAGAFRFRDDQVSLSELDGFSYRNLEFAFVSEGLASLGRTLIGKKAEQISLQDACNYASAFFAIEDGLPENSAGEGKALRRLLHSKKSQPNAHECIPHSLLLAGDGAGAQTASQGQALPDSSSALFDQVTAHWMAGDMGRAAADMARYYQAKVAGGQVTAFDSLRMLTLLQRQGRPVPGELLERASGGLEGPWPMPLLAMQAGKLEPAQVVAIAKTLPPDASEMALNDYWFQVGQLALIRSDIDAARKAFRWFKANGIRSQLPSLLARAELARLVKPEPDVDAAIRLLGNGAKSEGLRLLHEAAQKDSARAQFKLADMYEKGEVVSKDMAKAAQLYLAAANQGHADAQNSVGLMFASGNGVKKDSKLAIEWYERAASNGSETAMYNLARRYRSGDGVEKNRETAAGLMREAAELGDGDAQALLASYYRLGVGLKVDYKLARFWATRAIQQGATVGYFELGKLRLKGLGIEKDEDLGQQLIRKSADLGDAVAQVSAAYGYLSGGAAKEDPVKAFKYFQMAADQGDSEGMMRVGYMYRDGNGVKADLLSARTWLEKAHEKKDTTATHLLADMMFRGWGGVKDVQGAIDLWSQNAAEFAESAYTLGLVYHWGHEVAVNYDLAAKFYRIAAEKEYAPALNNLGDFYENGTGVERNFPAAIDLYKRAAIKEHGFAFFSLSHLFEHGMGLRKDIRMAYLYSALAERFGCEAAVKVRASLAKQLPVESLKEDDLTAAAWTVKQGLPGFNEASASPAGRE